MKKKLNLAAILICLSVLVLNMVSCDNGTTGGGGGEGPNIDPPTGSDKWSELIGNWEWTEGPSRIRLEIDGEKFMGGYSFQIWRDLPSSISWGNVFLCSYNGTTLRRYDYPDTTEQTFTVVKSSDGQTLTFSNYQDPEGDGDLSELDGKNFTRVFN